MNLRLPPQRRECDHAVVQRRAAADQHVSGVRVGVGQRAGAGRRTDARCARPPAIATAGSCVPTVPERTATALTEWSRRLGNVCSSVSPLKKDFLSPPRWRSAHRSEQGTKTLVLRTWEPEAITTESKTCDGRSELGQACESRSSEQSCRAATAVPVAPSPDTPTSTSVCKRKDRRDDLLDLHPGDAPTAVWTLDYSVSGTDVRVGLTFRGRRADGSLTWTGGRRRRRWPLHDVSAREANARGRAQYPRQQTPQRASLRQRGCGNHVEP